MSTQTTIDSAELFIGGEWIAPQGTGRISVIGASTEEVVGSVPDGVAEAPSPELDRRLELPFTVEVAAA